jgi:hypothetical protein
MKSRTHQRLTRKSYSFSVPLELAARIAALCEMHPQKSRSQIIGEVLGLGLADMERSWAQGRSEIGEFPPATGQEIQLQMEPFSEFHRLIYKHHLAMERGLGKDEPPPPFPTNNYLPGDIE